jgi:hypothetical protein
MNAFVSWILAASLSVTDSAGHHPIKGIALEGAQAIADACSKVRLSNGSDPRPMCASVYLVMAFRESGYQLNAVGDHGHSFGPFQTRVAPKSWKEAVDQYTPILQRSAAMCTEPLALLASGSCTNKAGIEISRARMAEAKRVSTSVPWDAGAM